MLWEIFLGILAVLIILFLMNFYRDPERMIPHGPKLIVAPADGKVISIIDTEKDKIRISKGLFGKINTMTKDIAKNCYVISIFMSPLDVHINRCPISGTVKSVKHTDGKFFKAYDLEKSFENEKNEIVIENDQIKVKFIQIAGFLARRIICKLAKNQKVKIGDRMGMIALGSQTTIILPKSVYLNVHKGKKVVGGHTIIAHLK